MDSYSRGWVDAISAITDLVLAEGLGIVDAQTRCMDWHYEKLLPRTVIPVMPRETLRTVIPFDEEPEGGHDGR